MALSAGGLLANNYNVAQFIEPNPINYKIIRTSNTNFSNLSYKRRLSQILKVDSYSQQVTTEASYYTASTGTNRDTFSFSPMNEISSNYKQR